MRYDDVLRRLRHLEDKYETDVRALLASAAKRDETLEAALLKHAHNGNGHSNGHSHPIAKAARKKYKLSAKQRSEIGARMKKYWAKRRREEGATV